jgi:1,2-diacylglycerol 3-beta-glucosyltransferase
MNAGGTATDRRRGSATLLILVCGFAGIFPHWMGPVRGLIPALTLALLVGSYSLRVVLAHGVRLEPGQGQAGPLPSSGTLSPVDVVVAARDEEAVIASLVERLSALRYPQDLLRIWIVDDGSSDGTPRILDQLRRRYSRLQVLRRSPDEGGGKSGALNRVLSDLRGEWMLVLDADATLPVDTLERLIPYAEHGGWAAVQLRKAETNGSVNLLTRAQAMEMAFDAIVQEGRLALGGVAELRGNGQLLRRSALIRAGGFNEATVTDDLDLTFRFLLADLPIGLMWNPAVEEEAVLSLRALWRQRQRWAEGGLQRFFDYGPQLLSRRLSLTKRWDLASFFLIQYALPLLSGADLIGSVLTRSAPLMWPFSIVTVGLSGAALLKGTRRSSEGPPLPEMNPLAMALALLYLSHWLVVIPWVTLRMAFLPKRLVWAKTTHHGAHDPTLVVDLEGDDQNLASDSDPELATEAGHF